MRDQYQDGIGSDVVFRGRSLMVRFATARQSLVISVPSEDFLQGAAASLVQRSPLFAVLASIAPFLWLAHAVPLEIDFDTRVTCVSNIARWDRLRR